jgi:hypothetical protein
MELLTDQIPATTIAFCYGSAIATTNKGWSIDDANGMIAWSLRQLVIGACPLQR